MKRILPNNRYYYHNVGCGYVQERQKMSKLRSSTHGCRSKAADETIPIQHGTHQIIITEGHELRTCELLVEVLCEGQGRGFAVVRAGVRAIIRGGRVTRNHVLPLVRH